jgi:hypothetical protein
MMRNGQVRTGRRLMSLLIGLLFVLALPAAAQASKVGAVTVEACSGEGGCVPTNQVRVDQQFGISLRFHVTSGLGPGSHFYVQGPEGFVFANGINHTQINYGGGGYSDGGHGTFNEGRGFEMAIASFGPVIAAGGEVELDIGLFEDKLTTPPQPGTMHFQVWTSSDNEARESSNAITTTLGEPAIIDLFTLSMAGEVGHTFAGKPEVELRDSRGNLLPGKTITFEVPATEPSGIFTGGLTSSTGETDADGIAMPSLALQAGTTAGAWEVTVRGPNSTSAKVPITNLVGPAEHVEISLQPNTLPADESSTSEATIEVTDAYGNKVTGDNVTVESAADGPGAAAPSLQGNGTFISLLTASRTPGEYAIAATDTTAGVSESATLTQTKLPATSIELSLEPSTVVADPLEKAVAIATVTDELGQPVSGDEVEFESPFSEGLQAPVDNGDGSYTWAIPVTATPGKYEITAVDESVEPSISDSATLTETAKPVTPEEGSGESGSTPEQGSGGSGSTQSGGNGSSNTPAPPAPEAPAVKIAKCPKGTVHRGHVQFAFAAVAGGAASFQCRLDDGVWKRCSSPTAFAVKPGRHVFQVRALSAGGAAGPVAKRVFVRAAKPQRRRHTSD